MAKGDLYRCPKCSNSIREGDCVYTEVICTRTVKCREKGGTRMTKQN